MFDVLLLAIALSMDAFAVSIGLGAASVTFKNDQLESYRTRSVFILALLAAGYFGFFQGGMPLLGYLGGKSVLGWLGGYAVWVAAALLFLIGGKMLYESWGGAKLAEESTTSALGNKGEASGYASHRLLLGLAIATSIDALAAGFALNLLPFSAYFSCAIIAGVTGVLSLAGVYLGRQVGQSLGEKAELLGGVVLLLIGVKLLL